MTDRAFQNVLFAGCRPEIAARGDGTILAVGPAARAAAGRRPQVIELEGRVLPGLVDAHLHLQWLAQLRLSLDLSPARTRAQALDRVRAYARRLPAGRPLVGRGWNDAGWSGERPHRSLLDSAAGDRVVILRRQDGHSAWLSSRALQQAGIDERTPEPPGGVIERESDGQPTGIVREEAVALAERILPPFSNADLDRALAGTLRALNRRGLTAVHSMDPVSTFSALQRLRRSGRLPVRVVYNLPLAEFAHAERMGVTSGWGSAYLRIWGVKAFLDGSLGSGTAQMLGGGGVEVLPQPDLVDLAARAARAELNLCLHAIGDAAVRRALDALAPQAAAWALWRPRIEHAQCVDEADMPRFARAGVIASMQPVHAVSDREMADREWGARVRGAYAWGALERAGAVLAFGSDAPVEPADPLAGIKAATRWRRVAGWHPELAISRRSALAAYTSGAAYAAGMEALTGRLRPGLLCDLTVVDALGVTATVVGARVVWRRRRPPKASPSSAPGAR